MILQKHHEAQKWLIVSLFYLVLVAFAGTILRLLPLQPLPINYKYLLHSHSHVAMLGWIYGAIFIGLLSAYLPTSFQNRSFRFTYWFAQAMVLGMFFTFIYKGYWLLSIICSTLHIFIYYFFIYLFLKHIKKDQIKNIFPVSLKFQYAALFFMFLSSFGPWSLSVIAAKGLAGSDLYYQSIYFYLHFQYNGFFLFCILGFLIWLLEKRNIDFNKSYIKFAFWLLFIATIPGYFLSLLGYDVPSILKMVAAASGILQFIASVILAYVIANKIQFITSNAISKNLLRLVLLLFILKSFMQLLSGIPFIGEIAFVSRDVAIGYLHLVMLGMITIGLITFFDMQQLINFSKVALIGYVIFLTGFLFNEVLLFLNGLLFWIKAPVIPFYLYLILIMSILMLIGLSIFFYSQFSLKKSKD